MVETNVIIDRHLKSNDHIEYVKSLVRTKLACIRRLSYVFDYCDVVWSDSSITLKNSLEQLHNGAVRPATQGKSTVSVPFMPLSL